MKCRLAGAEYLFFAFVLFKIMNAFRLGTEKYIFTVWYKCGIGKREGGGCKNI